MTPGFAENAPAENVLLRRKLDCLTGPERPHKNMTQVMFFYPLKEIKTFKKSIIHVSDLA